MFRNSLFHFKISVFIARFDLVLPAFYHYSIACILHTCHALPEQIYTSLKEDIIFNNHCHIWIEEIYLPRLHEWDEDGAPHYSPSNTHTTQQETKTTVMKLSQKINHHLRPLQVNKEQAWAIWEGAAGNLMCLSKQVADTRNRTSKSCIGYWWTKDENWRKRSTKQRKRRENIIFECGRKWGWYERSPEICWKPRKQSIMSPVSTKMSINHSQNSFTLEEGSPRDCLHV